MAARLVKNVSFPFSVRGLKSKDDSLLGYYPISHLALFEQADKLDQLLFFYNCKKASKIKRVTSRNGKTHNIPTHYKTASRMRQVTCVLDFDTKGSDIGLEIDKAFLVFNEAIGGKGMCLRSPSGGRHVMFVADLAFVSVTEDTFGCLVKSVATKWFSNFVEWFDEGASSSLNRGFFHSQHLGKWIDSGIVNVTPSKQDSGECFWNETQVVGVNALFEIIKGNVNVADDVHMMHFYVSYYALIQEAQNAKEEKDRSGNIKQEQCIINTNDYSTIGFRESSKEERTKASLEEKSKEFARVLDVAIAKERVDSGRSLKRARKAAQGQQYQTAYSCIESLLGVESFAATRLPEVSRALVSPRVDGARVQDSITEHARSEDEDGPVCLQADTQAGNGHISGHHSGPEGHQERGLRGHFSTDGILDVIQDIRVLCKARNVNLKKLGDIISTHSLRSHLHWELTSEESDLSLFAVVVRQVLDKDPGISGAFGAGQDRDVTWFGYAKAYLANSESVEGSLLASTKVIFNGLRLYCKSQNIRYTLGIEASNERETANVDNIKAEAFVDMLFPDGDCSTRCPSIVRANVQSLNRMYKEDKQRLVDGFTEMFLYIKKLYPKVQSKTAIAVGVEDFQAFFNTHIRKAGALRMLAMSQLATISKDYIACVRRKAYYINDRVLEQYLLPGISTLEAIPASAEKLADKLGDGHTWEAICKYTLGMYRRLGVKGALDMWVKAIDIADGVNGKHGRVNDVRRFLDVIHCQCSTAPEEIRRRA